MHAVAGRRWWAGRPARRRRCRNTRPAERPGEDGGSDEVPCRKNAEIAGEFGELLCGSEAIAGVAAQTAFEHTCAVQRDRHGRDQRSERRTETEQQQGREAENGREDEFARLEPARKRFGL